MLGFSPEGLAASGATPLEVDNLLAELSSLTAERSQLQVRLDAAHTAMMAFLQVQAAHQAGQASDADLDSARAQQHSAQAAVDELVNNLWNDLAEPMAPATRARLSAWRSNAAARLPAEFRIVAWSSDGRKELERAIIAERRSQVIGEPLDSGAAQMLASARSRSDVAEATIWLQTRLPDIRQAFAGE